MMINLEQEMKKLGLTVAGVKEMGAEALRKFFTSLRRKKKKNSGEIAKLKQIEEMILAYHLLS